MAEQKQSLNLSPNTKCLVEVVRSIAIAIHEGVGGVQSACDAQILKL